MARAKPSRHRALRGLVRAVSQVILKSGLTRPTPFMSSFPGRLSAKREAESSVASHIGPLFLARRARAECGRQHFFVRGLVAGQQALVLRRL
jgi:hypothetical protein